MRVEQTVIGHPTQRQLMAFAESLVDRHTPVSALLASHVADCPVCAHEVRQIRASFELAALSRLPEPSSELTQRIIAQARRQRRQQPQDKQSFAGALSRILQIAACAAATVALAYFSFSAALSDLPEDTPDTLRDSFVAMETVSEQDAIVQQADSVKALATALLLQQGNAVSPYEMGHRRALDALNRDMSAALAALDRNPGCVRANQVMLTSVRQQLEGLRNLYLDRQL